MLVNSLILGLTANVLLIIWCTIRQNVCCLISWRSSILIISGIHCWVHDLLIWFVLRLVRLSSWYRRIWQILCTVLCTLIFSGVRHWIWRNLRQREFRRRCYKWLWNCKTESTWVIIHLKHHSDALRVCSGNNLAFTNTLVNLLCRLLICPNKKWKLKILKPIEWNCDDVSPRRV